MTRIGLERIWRRPGVAQMNGVAVWDKHGVSSRGDLAQFRVLPSVAEFRRKVLGGHGWPVWSKTKPSNIAWPLTPPALYVERIEADCPRNAKAILAAYGTSDPEEQQT